MAAGLTLPRSAFPAFTRAFDEAVSSQLQEEDLTHALQSDGELQASELTLELAEVLREAGPWGQSFPEPLFDNTFTLLEQRLVGGKHLKMVLGKDLQPIDAIAFNVDLNEWPNHRCESVHVAYRMDVNEYRGKRTVQLIVEHLEVV